MFLPVCYWFMFEGHNLWWGKLLQKLWYGLRLSRLCGNACVKGWPRVQARESSGVVTKCTKLEVESYCTHEMHMAMGHYQPTNQPMGR